MTLVALVVIAPVAILLGPLMLRFAALGGGAGTDRAAAHHHVRTADLLLRPGRHSHRGDELTAVAMASAQTLAARRERHQQATLVRRARHRFRTRLSESPR
jgi:hypothetical protein